MATIRQVKRKYNPSIEVEGVLLTMYDGRLNLTNQVVAEIKRFFPDRVYRTTIPRNVRLSRLPVLVNRLSILTRVPAVPTPIPSLHGIFKGQYEVWFPYFWQKVMFDGERSERV